MNDITWKDVDLSILARCQAALVRKIDAEMEAKRLREIYEQNPENWA